MFWAITEKENYPSFSDYPGIDFAGTVYASEDPFAAGQKYYFDWLGRSETTGAARRTRTR